MVTKLEGLPYVDRVVRVQSPHKRMEARGSLATHRLELGGIELGREPFFRSRARSSFVASLTLGLWIAIVAAILVIAWSAFAYARSRSGGTAATMA